MDSLETTPNTETSTPVEQPNTIKIEIDGEEQELSIDELKNGYLRQSDYTRKTQTLAEERKQLEELKKSSKQEDEPEEVINARTFLDNEGVVKKNDLEAFKKQIEYETKFGKILSENPELQSQEKAIRDLQQATGWAFEDVITKYGFSDSNKLAKAKRANGSLPGSKTPEGEKSIKDMSPAEYAEYRKEKGIRDRY